MGHHVLVRMDSTMTVVYINRQGGLCFHQLYMLARKLILWSSPLPESNARPGIPEHRRTSILGVDSTPGNCGRDMGPPQSGHGGSVYVERKCKVHDLLK